MEKEMMWVYVVSLPQCKKKRHWWLMNIQQHRPRNLEIKRDPRSLIFNLFYTRGHLVKRMTFHNKVNSWNNLAAPWWFWDVYYFTLVASSKLTAVPVFGVFPPKGKMALLFGNLSFFSLSLLLLLYSEFAPQLIRDSTLRTIISSLFLQS